MVETNAEEVKLKVLAIENKNQWWIAAKLFNLKKVGDVAILQRKAVRAFLEDSGYDKSQIAKDVILQIDSKHQRKYAKFYETDTAKIVYLRDWSCCHLVSKNSITNACISSSKCLVYDVIISNTDVKHILSTDIALKYYPSRKNSVRFVKADLIEHPIEGVFKLIDGALREHIGKDDLLYDIHRLNARFYLKHRKNLCDE